MKHRIVSSCSLLVFCRRWRSWRRWLSAMVDEAASRQGLSGRHGTGLERARRRRLHRRQLRPRHLDMERRRDPLHGQARRRDPHQKAGDQFRAGRRVEAPAHRAETRGSSSGPPRRHSRASSPTRSHGAASRCRYSTTDTRSNTRNSPARKATWFTTDGDVFAVGTSKMTPFAPVSPDGSRSFPTKHLSKGVGEWNHYYVRGNQRRGPALGQRRGSIRRQRLRAAVGVSLPGIGRFAGRVPADAHPRTAVSRRVLRPNA